jgi:alkylation response protein AidB-like acyl-CoA dehydrogenase
MPKPVFKTRDGRDTSSSTETVSHEASSVLGPELPVAPHDDPFRVELRSWLGQARPGVEEPLDLGARFEFGRAWQRTLFEGGWAGPAWPKRFGGRDATALQQFMYYEELARGGGGGGGEEGGGGGGGGGGRGGGGGGERGGGWVA